MSYKQAKEKVRIKPVVLDYSRRYQYTFMFILIEREMIDDRRVGRWMYG